MYNPKPKIDWDQVCKVVAKLVPAKILKKEFKKIKEPKNEKNLRPDANHKQWRAH